jgi:hypothetical protein
VTKTLVFCGFVACFAILDCSFKTGAFNRSATHPQQTTRILRNLFAGESDEGRQLLKSAVSWSNPSVMIGTIRLPVFKMADSEVRSLCTSHVERNNLTI